MKVRETLSKEHLDFLREMMNIGAGNAATALGQMLRCEVNVAIPKVHLLSAVKLPPKTFGDPSLPVFCVRMAMIGDAFGHLFFIVPDAQKERLTHLVEQAAPGSALIWNGDLQSAELDLSVLTEVGNILVGVYLTAIHDFCKLNIYHTAPTLAIDMIQSLLDESLATLSHKVQTAVLIENMIYVGAEGITTFLLMIPSVESVNTLADSIAQTRLAYSKE